MNRPFMTKGLLTLIKERYMIKKSVILLSLAFGLASVTVFAGGNVCHKKDSASCCMKPYPTHSESCTDVSSQNSRQSLTRISSSGSCDVHAQVCPHEKHQACESKKAAASSHCKKQAVCPVTGKAMHHEANDAGQTSVVYSSRGGVQHSAMVSVAR